MRAQVTQISALTAAAAHVLCFAGLAAAYALAGRGALVSNPALALQLLVVCEAPVVIAVFSYLRRDPKSCSFVKAAARGLIGLPVGALLNAFGAIVLGAPVGIKYWTVTIYWSLLMSMFTFVPAACVFGASKIDWQNVLSHSIYFTPTDVENYMISSPCHGAVLGAWLGAWPMPLDWERPWQGGSVARSYPNYHYILFLNKRNFPDDITPMHTSETSPAVMQGPVTRVRARQLNQQVNSLLSSSACTCEDGILPNDIIDYIVLRNFGENYEVIGDQQGQGGRPSQVGAQFISESVTSAFRTSVHQIRRPGHERAPILMIHICLEDKNITLPMPPVSVLLNFGVDGKSHRKLADRICPRCCVTNSGSWPMYRVRVHHECV